MKRYRIAVDIGGTFVDAVVLDSVSGETRLEKASTTPKQPTQGVLEAIRKLNVRLEDAEMIVHGTTLGLNAILERKGSRTGILTTEGFRDVFEIARADIPSSHIYDYQYQKPPLLVKRRLRLGVHERLDANGDELEPLSETDLLSKASLLVDRGAEAIAVCFLHSYRNPVHEQRAVELLRDRFPGIIVSASSDITREYREYERTCTVVLEAYIRPIYERYIDHLQRALAERGFCGRFLLMRSSGGAMTAERARRSPIQTVLSGPAGGIVGAEFLARTLRRPRLLTLDFGGTSLDACMIEDGEPTVVHEASLEHLPVLIPVFDIRCIGAGGGSIAWMQEDLLKVGPQSAGADPGPIAYGRGGEHPTTTDAAIVLGYLDPSDFLKGAMALDSDAARRGIEDKLVRTMGGEVTEAAAAVFDVMIARTVGAIREITIERGHDAADFSALAFGGAGPMLSPLLAREMGIPEVIVPTSPGAFSAWGMLMADLAVNAARTVLLPAQPDSQEQLESVYGELERQVRDALLEQNVEESHQSVIRSMELRYVGQEHALELWLKEGPDGMSPPLDLATVRLRFDERHRQRYGHATKDAVEIVALRVQGTGRMDKPVLPEMNPEGPESSGDTEARVRQAYCFALRKLVPFRVFQRDTLHAGQTIDGPAIVGEGTSTTVFYSDQTATVDRNGQLVIKIRSTT